ncbi:MAG: hypothetical protein ABIP58_03810 [Dehalococcoidia bacterium]
MGMATGLAAVAPGYVKQCVLDPGVVSAFGIQTSKVGQRLTAIS